MSIYEAISSLENQYKAGALCTIVRSRGSTPRRDGSKMLVFEDGATTGTVGGGELEARVVTEALAARSEGRPRTLDYERWDPASGDP